jgi:phosphoribosyl 1,2-cyclic phosphodiesterase
MLEIDVLASGSSGNSYLITTADNAVFVDIGVTKRDIVRFKEKINGKKVSLFLSHEHIDHIKGLKYFQSLFDGEVFCGYETAKYLHQSGFYTDNLKVIEPSHMYIFNGWQVSPFELSHDSSDIFGFRFDFGGYVITFVTDTGEVCNNTLEIISNTDLLFLESNYEDDMLIKGKYPQHLKKRILSSKGHLSNKDAIKVLHEIYGSRLEKVCFSHISEENNSYDLMERYCKYCEKTIKVEAKYLKQRTHYSFKIDV